MTTHVAWDRGVVTEEGTAMIAIEMGVYYQQKTCKTYCGKRVKMARINNESPDCVDCRRQLVADARRNREGLLAIRPNDPMLTMTVAEKDVWERAIASCEATIRRYA